MSARNGGWCLCGVALGDESALRAASQRLVQLVLSTILRDAGSNCPDDLSTLKLPQRDHMEDKKPYWAKCYLRTGGLLPEDRR